MMKFSIWLDDIREIPEGFDYWAKTAQDCIFMINTLNIDFISFDHDLGYESGNTGYTVAQYIEKLVFMGEIERIEYNIHSANPTGRKIFKWLCKAQSDFGVNKK